MKKFYKTIFLVVIISIIFCTVYVAMQQILRQSANDPQIQIAEDTANALAGGAVPADFMLATRTTFDMSKSLATFTMIFDESSTLLESSADLHGSSVALPIGVFDYTKINGEDRFTWQPEKGVRNAIVLRHYGGLHPGFVLVGRSLREIEIQEDNLMDIVGFGWLVSVVFTLGFSLWYNRKEKLNLNNK